MRPLTSEHYGGVTRFGCLTLLLWKLRLMSLKNKRHKGTVIGVESTRVVRLQVDLWQQLLRLLSGEPNITEEALVAEESAAVNENADRSPKLCRDQ